jgi:hypothetical protein
LKDGRIRIGKTCFEAVVLPADVALPESAAKVVSRFRSGGGCVVEGGGLDLERLRRVQPLGRLEPPCGHVVVGRFRRDRRDVLLVVNAGGKPYEGKVVVGGGTWWQADPATGRVERHRVKEGGAVPVSLQPHRAVLLTGSKP